MCNPIGQGQSGFSSSFQAVLAPVHKNFCERVLTGGKAFYCAPDYVAATQKDFAAKEALPASYTWNTECKIIRIAKQILSMLILPVGLYQLVHALVGLVIVPASVLPAINKLDLAAIRSSAPLDKGWKYKRITVAVDGYKIDAIIVGKAETLGNGRWMLASLGNGELYEDVLYHNHDCKKILSQVAGNAIIFNYPGVGASSGMPGRQTMAKAYRAMLTFLEDKNNGIGAAEIIGYGHSIGGGVQADALRKHKLKANIKYVFVKSKTFSDLSTAASTLIAWPFGFLVKILGWNIDVAKSSKRLQVPEIIMQAGATSAYGLDNSSQIIGDGIISREASLAKSLLDDNHYPRNSKMFIKMSGDHNSGLHPLEEHIVGRSIQTCLDNYYMKGRKV